MNQKLGNEFAIDWKHSLVAFMVVYMAITAVQYYNTVLYTALMMSLATPLILAFAGIVIVAGRSLQSFDSRILLGIAIWTYVAELVHGLYSFTFFSSVYFDVLYYALICFPLAGLLGKKRRKRSSRLLFHAFIGFLFVFAIFALYMVFTQQTMRSQNDVMLGQLPQMTNRLWMFMHPNYAGTFYTIAMLLSIYLGLSAKKVPERIYCVVAFIVFGVILALTDSRTSKLAVSVGVGVLGFVLVRAKVYPRKGQAASILAGVAATAVVAGVCYFSFFFYGLLVQGIMSGPQASALSLVQTAAAEEAAGAATSPLVQVSSRGMFLDAGMNGRDKIWKAALEAIRNDPAILFFGTGYNNIIATVIGYTDGVYIHMHNSFLQMLMAVGLPGLLLLLWFLARLMMKCIRLLLDTSGRISLASRFLPAVLLSCVVISLAESHFFMTDQAAYDPIFFLVAGYVSVIAPKRLVGAGEGE